MSAPTEPIPGSGAPPAPPPPLIITTTDTDGQSNSNVNDQERVYTPTNTASGQTSHLSPTHQTTSYSPNSPTPTYSSLHTPNSPASTSDRASVHFDGPAEGGGGGGTQPPASSSLALRANDPTRHQRSGSNASWMSNGTIADGATATEGTVVGSSSPASAKKTLFNDVRGGEGGEVEKETEHTAAADAAAAAAVKQEKHHSEKKGVEVVNEGKKKKKRGLFGRKEKKEADDEDEDDEEDEDAKNKAQTALDFQSQVTLEANGFDPTPFASGPKRLASLVDPKNLKLLSELGGVGGLLEGLGTDGKQGLSVATLEGDGSHGGGGAKKAGRKEREAIYGANVLPVRESKSLFYLMYLALKDKVLIILCIAAVVSLALGLYQDLGTAPETYQDPGCPNNTCTLPQVDWVEGVAIMVAVIIVVLVGSVNDWQKEKQFQKLNAKKEDRGVKVIRDGKEQIIGVHDVLVGDICLLEPGEIIPCDGIFLRGHGVRCDESGATGESDAIKKLSYDEVVAAREGVEETEKGFKEDCFLLSGAKVLEGVGEYVVIAVGENSFNGRTLMALRAETPATPLQLKLNALAELIAKLGSLAGGLLFFSLMIRFFVQLGTGNPVRTSSEKGQAFVDILIIAVTIIVVAVPEGLPLAVTLALAFATKRMTKENLLVRVLGSCETMAGVSTVCSDKTGTLTQNVMSVVAGSVGVHGKFVQRLEENKARTNANNVEVDDGKPEGPRKGRKDFSIEMSELNNILSPALQELFNDSVVVNSTAFEDANKETGELEFVGSKTETALLRFAKDLGWKPYKETRESAKIMQMIPFSSERKCMGVAVQLPSGKYRVYFKGASEILTKVCTRHISISPAEEGVAASGEVATEEFNDETRVNINRTIIFYANQMLRTIAICYRDFDSWPPVDMDENNEVPVSWLQRDLTLLAVVGIEDPLRPGVKEAVDNCRTAGVAVKMCTGDNVLTARSIASQCGIYGPGGLIMEGPVFRTLSKEELIDIVPRLQVLARSSPEDKKILVKTLQELGGIVGVTGDGTNDAPALKQADVGFSMGIAGTEVAKEASDIILMDDSFTSIVTAIIWGRCVNDSVKKFLQFQISVNITAVIITFVSAVASTEETSVLTAVQLLWVNLIMDTFAALALATDPATRASLNRAPDAKTAPLITLDMAKMISMQAVYQVIVCLVLHFKGTSILSLSCDTVGTCLRQEEDLNTLVFNVFVWCQIFNVLNCRRLDRGLNIFADFFKNAYFLVIWAIMIAGQILIVFVGGRAFQVTRIGGNYWGISIVIGFLSIPLGAIVRLLPTEPFAQMMYKLRIYKDPSILPEVSPQAEEANWNEAISKTINNLNTFGQIRGGRLRSSSMVLKSRSARLKASGVEPTSLLAMVPMLVATSVGGGWAPTQAHGSSLEDPSAGDPSRSSQNLWQGLVQIHPDTDKNDPYFQRFGIKP